MTVGELWKISSPADSRCKIDFEYYDKQGAPLNVEPSRVKDLEVICISEYCLIREPVETVSGYCMPPFNTLRLRLTLDVIGWEKFCHGLGGRQSYV